MNPDYMCTLLEFLRGVEPDTPVLIRVDAYPNDLFCFTCDGTDGQARRITRGMFNTYKHGLLVIGVSIATAKYHTYLKVTCR